MSEPLVSVVIPSVSGLPSLLECLEALSHQDTQVLADVIVVDRLGEETRAAARQRFPGVQVLAAEPGTSIPRLRAIGVARASAPLVAFLEDHCNVDRSWLGVIERAAREGKAAFGGVVENGAVERAVDWAAFLCEYARFLPPLRRGETSEITGNNSVYDRALLQASLAEAGGEVWESFLHERLRQRGVPLHCEPDLRVLHKKRFGFAYFVSQRYHYSRSFAGMRLAGAPAWKRLVYVCATPALPLLLLGRIGGAVLKRRRHLPEFSRALPILTVFLLVWAFGEAVGALLGAGRSLELVD